jgi:hypothetical protein
MVMALSLDVEQLRILGWRAYSGDVAAFIGPPGCGKTTVGSVLAMKMITEGIAERVLLVAYTNAAADEFAWELYNIFGAAARTLCIRTGNAAGANPLLPIPFSVRADEIRQRRIVICTTLSLRRLSYTMRFDNMIIDEAGIEKLEDLLAPFCYGVNQLAPHLLRNSPADNNNSNNQVNNLMDLISHCGIVATVVGDPKQSRPIGLARRDSSAIEWVLKRAPSDTLRITHRLPDKLSGLVDEFAVYEGLTSAQDIALRRLSLQQQPDLEYRTVIDPGEVITWVDINGTEEEILATSWANDLEARACAKICSHLTHVASNKSIVIVTRFTGQQIYILNYLNQMGLNNIRVVTTTGALGTQADIVIYSLVRNNPEKKVGAAGTLQDVNVAISRAKEKLIIVGNFDMMLNGWSWLPGQTRYGYKSPSRLLARLVDSKYGKVVDAPQILTRA